MKLYINYTTPSFSIYGENQESGNIEKHNISGQRKLDINDTNYSDKLKSFLDDYKFNSNIQHQNDLWVSINVSTPELAKNIADQILQKLKSKHKAFREENYTH